MENKKLLWVLSLIAIALVGIAAYAILTGAAIINLAGIALYCGGDIPCNCTASRYTLNDSRTFDASDDLTSCANGLNIVADNITLDCNDYTISGSDTGNGIDVTGRTDVTIKNCIITHFVNSILLSSSSNITVTNNTANSNSYGIILTSASENNTVSDNTLNSNTFIGLYLDSASNNNTFRSNTINSNTQHGVYIASSSYNTLSDNTVNGNSEVGIYLISASNNNTINDNTVDSNSVQNIMLVGGSDNNTIDDNTVTNSATGIYLGSTSGCSYNIITNNNASYNSWNGISLDTDSNYNTIENNTANYNTNNGIGLWSGSSGNTISGNTVNNNDNDGVYIESGPSNNVSGNTANNNRGNGIYLESSSSNTLTNNIVSLNLYGIRIYSDSNSINYNSIYNNTDYDAEDNGASNNFTFNYWGETLCDAKLSSLSKSEATPYYTDAALTSSSSVVPYCTCGDDATNDTTLTADVTGCSGNGVNIAASDIVFDCNGHKITGTSGVTGIRINAYSNVTIKNCEISGFDNGILSSNADENNILNNNIHNSTQYNIGIRTANNYTISGNHLSYASAGLRISNANDNDIFNNTITNNIGDLGHGISLVTSSSNNTIRDNTITLNKIGLYYASTSGEDNPVTDNSINNNCEGMRVYNSVATIEDTDFTSNSNYAMDVCSTATAPRTGLYVESSSTVSITNGDFLDNGQFGIYGDSDSNVDLTVEQAQTCRNNMIYINTGSFTDDDENLTKDNCPMDIDGSSDTEPAMSCGDTATTNITLNQPIDCSGYDGAALTVGADDITIDCDDWAIFGNSDYNGIDINGYNGVTIKNCELDSSYYGIYIYNSSDDSILNNKISNTYYSGIYIEAVREEGPTSDHTIKSNILKDTAQGCFGECSGIGAIELYYEDNCLIENNTIVRGGYNGISLYETNATQILSNTISDVYNMGIRLATNDEGYGGQNTVSSNTINNGCIGIRVASEENTITDNTITGTFDCDYWGVDSTYGIYTKSSYIEPENNYFSGNDVLGYYYGHYLQNIVKFTVTGDTYNNNTYGMYLQSVGDSSTGVIPAITDTTMNDNEQEGAHVVSSSIAEFIDPIFKRNLGVKGDDTGLYIESSTVYLTNGEFSDNAGYGLYDSPPVGTVYWTIDSDAVCRNNNMSINDGSILISGGALTQENCTIFLSGNEFNTSSDRSGYSTIPLSIAPDSNETVGSNSTGFEANIFVDADGYTGDLIVTTYDELPSGTSGYTSTALGTWLTFEAAGIEDDITWVIIKLYYTDAEISAAGLDENSLFIQYYNETSGTWESYNTECGNAPCGGVNTTGNYVWANTTHFSGYGVFGSPVAVNPVTSPRGTPSGAFAPLGTQTNWTGDILNIAMQPYDTVVFTFNSESHTIELMSLSPDSTVLWFSSEKISLTSKIGETKLVDIDADGTNDVSVYLSKIDSKAYFTFTKINPAQAPAEEQPATGAAPSESAASAQALAAAAAKNYGVYILGILALIAIIAVLYFIFFKKRAEEF